MQGVGKIAPGPYRRTSSRFPGLLVTESRSDDLDDFLGDRETAGDNFIGGSDHRVPVPVSSSPFTVTKNHSLLLVDTTGGAINLELPTDSDDGHLLIVQDSGGNAGTNNITITATGGKTINGGASVAITSNYGGLDITYDGTNYFAR